MSAMRDRTAVRWGARLVHPGGGSEPVVVAARADPNDNWRTRESLGHSDFFATSFRKQYNLDFVQTYRALPAMAGVPNPLCPPIVSEHPILEGRRVEVSAMG